MLPIRGPSLKNIGWIQTSKWRVERFVNPLCESPSMSIRTSTCSPPSASQRPCNSCFVDSFSNFSDSVMHTTAGLRQKSIKVAPKELRPYHKALCTLKSSKTRGFAGKPDVCKLLVCKPKVSTQTRHFLRFSKVRVYIYIYIYHTI